MTGGLQTDADYWSFSVDALLFVFVSLVLGTEALLQFLEKVRQEAA